VVSSMRLLCLYPGLVPPPKNPRIDQAFHFPLPLEGDLLLPVWNKQPEELWEALGSDSYPEHRVGNFTYHLFLAGRHRLDGVRIKVATFAFFLREGWRLSRKHRYDCILTYGWTLTGLAGLILAKLTGSKFIVMIMGVPENAYRFNSYGNPYGDPKRDLATRLARRVSDLLIHVVVGRADCARILYPDQLKAYPKLAHVPTYVTHDFVPMEQIRTDGTSDGSILLLGAPWYVKGIDLLIRAFRAIEADFPQTRLRLMGHYPGQDFKDLIGDSRQIEVLKARTHTEAMEVMANCGIFVLASRTESLGRVLLEAMAAGKPVIAPKVGGIPHYVQDGVTGLLFEREDVADLARQLRRLLASPDLQAQLGRKGMEVARTRYTEVELGRKLLDMVERTVHGRNPAPCQSSLEH
jgi:glycosyltransferase involved in cell wall biosynthesis